MSQQEITDLAAQLTELSDQAFSVLSYNMDRIDAVDCSKLNLIGVTTRHIAERLASLTDLSTAT